MPRRVVNGIQRMMQFLLPKEEEFFPLFAQMGEHAREAAVALRDLFGRYPDVHDLMVRIDELEEAVDVLKHDCTSRLHETFVTPVTFDRGDIFELAEILDDVVDFIKAAADRTVFYEPRAVPPAMLALADILVEATAVLSEACGRLEQLRPSETAFFHRINELENQADRVLKAGLAELFHNTADPIEVIKWKEIYDYVEEAIDHCEDTASLIEGSLVKNS